MKNIYLVRHTESEKNINDLFGDKSAKFSLTTKGKADAIRIGEFFNDKFKASEKNIAVFCSNEIRAEETGKAISIVLNTNLKHIDIASLNTGDIKGKTIQDAHVTHPEFIEKEQAFRKGILCGYNLEYPNGESIQEFQSRIIQVLLSNILITNYNPILFVTHQSVIGTILNYFKPKHFKVFDYEYLTTSLGAISLVKHDGKKGNMIFYNQRIL